MRDSLIDIYGPRHPKRVCNATRPPPITSVCQMIRRESLPLFYSKNKFAIIDDSSRMPGVEAWRRSLSDEMRAELQGLYAISQHGTLRQFLEDCVVRDRYSPALSIASFEKGRPSRNKDYAGESYKLVFGLVVIWRLERQISSVDCVEVVSTKHGMDPRV